MNMRVLRYGILFSLFLTAELAHACRITPSFTYTSSHTCGLPTIVYASNTSSGSNTNLAKYWWKINGLIYKDTIIGTGNSTLLLKVPGSNSVRLFVKDSAGCIDSSTSTVSVSTNAKSILDQNQVYTFSPVWMNCLQFITDPDSFRVNFESADSLKSLKIFWGDGSSDTSGTTIAPNTVKTHLYNNLGVFELKIVTVNGSCIDTVYGMVYNQRQPTAGIIGPTSGSNRGCVPHTLRIINNSYNISNNTTFLIDWGNGETIRKPYTSYKDTLFHTYKTGVCAGIIKITATNVCGSSFSTWNPIDISDKDKAKWGVSTTCTPNSNYVFQNLSSDQYCLIPDIKEYYWDFGDSTNSGWINSKVSQNHKYKKEGDYIVMLIAKTACGNDTFRNKVQVYYNPVAGFSYSASRSCKPLSVLVTDTSKGRGLGRQWRITEGSSVKTFTDSILNYTFTSPGTHTIQLSVSNICGTSSISRNFVVTDKPDAQFATINSSCIPMTVAFTNTGFSYFSNAAYSWDFGDSSYSTLKNPSNKIYSKAGNYTVKLIVSDSCGSDTFSQTFTAYGLPQSIFTGDSSACTFDSVLFSNTSLNSNTGIWDFGDNQTLVSGGNTSVKHLYTVSGNYTVRLISGAGTGCRDTSYRNILIKPGAKALFNINQSYACNPATFKFTNTSIYGKEYRWYANGKLISTSQIPNDTVLNTDTTVVQLKLIATSASSCQDDSLVKPYFTPKNPKAIIGNKDSGCSLLSVQFINQSSNFTTSHWNLGNGNSSSLHNPSQTYQGAGTKDTVYYPTLLVHNWANCKDSVQTQIKVFPGPKADFTLNTDKGCGPLQIQFTNTSETNNNDPFNSLSHSWNFGDGGSANSADPDHVFHPSAYKDTFYSISLKVSSANACTDSITKHIQVYPRPLVRFTPDKISGCAILPVHFSNHSLPLDTGTFSMMQFTWNSGNGLSSNDTSFAANYTASVYGDTTYNISLTGYSEHGCADTAYQTITVYPQPKADFTLSSNDACTPVFIKTNNRSSAPNGMVNSEWDFGNGYSSTLQNDSALYINNSNADLPFTISLQAISMYGCRDTTEQIVTIHPKPIASFTFPNQVYCAPALITLNDNSINAAQYYWAEGNTSFPGNTNANLLLPGLSLFDTSYIIAHQVVSSYGCASDTVYQFVQVNGRPVSDFKTNKDSVCSKEKIQFANASLAAFRYYWNFGDNTSSTTINPQHSFPVLNAGEDSSYKVSLEVVSVKGCRDTSSKNVHLSGVPKDKILLDKVFGCTDLQVKIEHKSTGYKTLFWDLGDNSPFETADSFTHIYVNSNGNFTVQPKITLYRQRFNCMDTSSSSIYVYPKPLADFTTQRNDPCDAGIYQIVNRSKFQTTNAWYIDSVYYFNGNSFSALLPGSINSDTAYTVQLIVTNNFQCSDTLVKTVMPKRKLKIDFKNTPDEACENTMVDFINQSSNSVRYFWKFGDGAVSNEVNPQHSFTGFGYYRVMLYGFDKDGCVDSSNGSNFVRVLERPKADFTFNPAYPQLPNAVVNFTATPFIVTVNQNFLNYEWDFGDNSFPTVNKNEKDPTHTYTIPGTVSVHLKVWNKTCMDEITKYFFIEDPKPVVDFTPDTLEGCVPLEVHFKNQTINVSSYRWIFGDGSPDSYQKEPTHVFHLPGTWDVTLIATGSGGTTTKTMKYLITTYPKPILDFYTNQSFMSLPNAVFNLRNTSNTVSNDWKLFDSLGNEIQGSKLRDPSFYVNRVGQFTVQLIGMNSYGCIDTLIKPSYLSTQGPGYVYVPNAFSPNKNLKNDGFSPSLFNVRDKNYSFKVFNRWGELLFETTDITGIWDGTFKGQTCSQEVYLWTVNGEYYNGDLFAFRGTVSLLR